MLIRVGGPPHNWKEFIVIDLETHKPISNVKEADDISGEYKTAILNPASGVALVNVHGQERIKTHRGSIKIVHKSQIQANNVPPPFTRNPNS